MVSTIFANITRPGVFLTEDAAGFRTPELASFNTVYMIGSAESGAFAVPTLVESLTDFTNQFGLSPSANSIRLYFRNDPKGKVFFSRTAIAPSFTVTVNTAVAGTQVIVVNGVSVSALIPASPTVQIVRDALIQAIALSPVGAAVSGIAVEASTSQLRIFARVSTAALTVTTASANLTIAAATPLTPQFNDFVSCIEDSYDADDYWEQGYLIAPQAFQSIAVPSQSLSVATAMLAHCSDKEFDWLAMVDCGLPVYAGILPLQIEAGAYTAPQGHLVFYAPHVQDLELTNVPPSAGVAGIATLRNREQGYEQPPAGIKYQMKGVTGVTQKFTSTQQSVLNPLGINLVRTLRNVGTVVWAARTRSADPSYKFLHTRVIMNAINGTLRAAFDNEIFNIVDGRGILFHRLTETTRSVLRRFWLSDALFGETEDGAFEVVCNFTNNDPADLDNGHVVLEAYCATSPILEKLLIRTFRVGIGQVAAASEAARVI
jgi:hypothetical protein